MTDNSSNLEGPGDAGEAEVIDIHTHYVPNGWPRLGPAAPWLRIETERDAVIMLGERDISHARPDIITGLGVARTFQNIRLFGAMTGVENVMIGRHARMKAGQPIRFSFRVNDNAGVGCMELSRGRSVAKRGASRAIFQEPAIGSFQ